MRVRLCDGWHGMMEGETEAARYDFNTGLTAWTEETKKMLKTKIFYTSQSVCLSLCLPMHRLMNVSGCLRFCICTSLCGRQLSVSVSACLWVQQNARPTPSGDCQSAESERDSAWVCLTFE